MRTFILSCSMLLGFLVYANGLKCMKCQGSSFEECDVTGELEQCMPNQRSCETTVRREGERMTVTKKCKNEGACRSNFLQNYGLAGKSTQCNADQTNSFCTCCCGTDLCNAGAPTCVKHYQNAAPVNDCPAEPENFPHGNIECYNENKVCEYQCTGQDYSVWPKGRDLNVCQGNGSWAQERPCCARPCPPYFLFDDAFLIHFSGEGNEEIFQMLAADVTYGEVAEDAAKIAGLYYSGEVLESSVFKFNEYESNRDRLREITRQRLQQVNEGPVNTGAAIQYALDNLLTPEAGMRDDRVPKTVTIITDKNADDDVKGPAEEARRRGYLVYVLAFESENYKLDSKQMLDMTGTEEHIYRFNGYDQSVLEAQYADMIKHFCQNPCDHVLHNHQ